MPPGQTFALRRWRIQGCSKATPSRVSHEGQKAGSPEQLSGSRFAGTVEQRLLKMRLAEANDAEKWLFFRESRIANFFLYPNFSAAS